MYLLRAASELGALPSLLGREGIGIVPDIYSPAELADIGYHQLDTMPQLLPWLAAAA